MKIPLSRKTSLAKSHHIKPIECGALLLQGIAMSTNLRGESVLQNAITGILT